MEAAEDEQSSGSSGLTSETLPLAFAGHAAEHNWPECGAEALEQLCALWPHLSPELKRAIMAIASLAEVPL